MNRWTLALVLVGLLVLFLVDEVIFLVLLAVSPVLALLFAVAVLAIAYWAYTRGYHHEIT